ncbi:MAG TPA: aminoacyl-tRNA hydrolase, partial [Polyangiaceae bacterium]|nr:aminoacyl-tRNA hydrolase [Polyangiaceae bacterium]
MRLVVGLGNPGPRYAGSPHNVGFRVVDHFAEHHLGAGRAAWSRRFDAEVLTAPLTPEPIVLLKPLTFMNRSGESVLAAMSFFKISVVDALVVHDELDLPFGSVKLKHGGGEAGHNGLKSVSAELGTRDYARLRVGVGRPAESGATGEVSDFLLAPLSSARATELEQSLGDTCSAIDLWRTQGLEQAMN